MTTFYQRDGRGPMRHDRWQSPTIAGYFVVVDRAPVTGRGGLRPHWSCEIRQRRGADVYVVAAIGMTPFTVRGGR